MRKVHLCVGYASVALGLCGTVLPLLPTTPFLLLAVWCFARSNPELAERLYRHPRFGPPLSDWRDQRAISRGTKAWALGMLALSYGISVWLTGRLAAALILAAVMGPVAAYLATRPGPRA